MCDVANRGDWTLVTSRISVDLLYSEGSGNSCWLNCTWGSLKLRWEVLKVQITPLVTLLFIACTALSSILQILRGHLGKRMCKFPYIFILQYSAVQNAVLELALIPQGLCDKSWSLFWKVAIQIESVGKNFNLGHKEKKVMFQAQINSR